MGSNEIAKLTRLAEDEHSTLSRLSDGTVLVPGFSHASTDDELIQAGLAVETGYTSPSGGPIVGLTPLGRVAGRLIFAPDPIPPELSDDRLGRLREQLDAEPAP
jgi:hypothetical protein